MAQEEFPRPGVRLSDAEREHAVGLLSTAHRDGRISLDELDRRLARVYGATTAGELRPVLHDVPTADERRALGGEVVELDVGDGLTRSGRWSVPRRLRVQQHVYSGGAVVLDFSSAEIAHPVVEIELRLGMRGSARLVVPRGGSADLSRLRGSGRLGRTDVRVERGADGVHQAVSGLVAVRREVEVHHPGARRTWWSGLLSR